MKKAKVLCILVSFAVVSCFICSIEWAQAATTSVNCSSQTLQSAIDAAASGDTLNVSGTCSENVNISKTGGLTINGQGGATISAPVSTSPAVAIYKNGTTLTGFTIQGGAYWGLRPRCDWD